ncbi:hypothetical protein J4219_00380 [Candidatus Woesearchaeota archaeon]|nr:hypothetical protein [Candidatus Woesearchaeota archaeon]
MNKLEKTLLGLAVASTLAGCVGSETPRYAGVPKDRAASVGSVESGTAYVGSATSSTVESRTPYVLDHTKDPELDLWNADRPFLIPREPRYQPTPRPATVTEPQPAPEPQVPEPEYNPQEEQY